ncbi:unnamed protein product [Didymodactylos carnosus]|uniref:Uncharacterized protein n=1 Tax=Didymodactylos carnosus TaxID=1234261 RepID=A0A815XCE8_9BILA|nr:unnamed protein product [Didymodactylos carnosus]CAF4416939.1 unnamed protein product [Didymodactylos carnosus]
MGLAGVQSPTPCNWSKYRRVQCTTTWRESDTEDPRTQSTEKTHMLQQDTNDEDNKSTSSQSKPVNRKGSKQLLEIRTSSHISGDEEEEKDDDEFYQVTTGKKQTKKPAKRPTRTKTTIRYDAEEIGSENSIPPQSAESQGAAELERKNFFKQWSAFDPLKGARKLEEHLYEAGRAYPKHGYTFKPLFGTYFQ